MRNRLSACGALAGAAVLLLAVPSAAADTVLIQKADPADSASTEVRLGESILAEDRYEHTMEQGTFACDPVDKDTCVFVVMSTGKLDSGSNIETGKVQGACFPAKMVQGENGPSLEKDVDNAKYITQREASNYRTFHHPGAYAIGQGLFAITANWRYGRNGNNNTNRFLQVVDSQCNLMELTGNEGNLQEVYAGTAIRLYEEFPEDSGRYTSAMIMAIENDNCSMQQSGGGASIHFHKEGDYAGKISYVASEGCNGNGEDDAWRNHVILTIGPDAKSVDVQKIGHQSYIPEEERSRGRCEQIDTSGQGGEPDLDVCCGTEGDNQPQEDGVWCAGFDHNTGELLWRELVAHMANLIGQDTYASRIKIVLIKDIQLNPTNVLALQWNDHVGRNNGDRKGGWDLGNKAAIARPDRVGLNMGEPMEFRQHVDEAEADMTHAVAFQTFMEECRGDNDELLPVLSLLTGSINGTASVNGMGDANAVVINLCIHPNNTLSFAGTTELNAPYDTAWYSKSCGGNPRNQGRNFTKCEMVPNPFMNEEGPTEGIPVINVCVLTGKYTSDNPAVKLDFVAELWTSLDPIPGFASANSSTGSGCNTGSGLGGAMALILIAFGFLTLRRRQQQRNN